MGFNLFKTPRMCSIGGVLKMIYAETIGKWIKVNFRYNPKVIEKIKTIKGRFYNPKTKNWGVPLEKKEEFEDKLADHLIIWKDGTKGKYDFSNKDWGVPKDRPVVPYNFKTKPMPHQIEGFNVLVINDKILLADEQGLGKTKIVIDAVLARRQLAKLKNV